MLSITINQGRHFTRDKSGQAFRRYSLPREVWWLISFGRTYRIYIYTALCNALYSLLRVFVIEYQRVNPRTEIKSYNFGSYSHHYPQVRYNLTISMKF